mmetsp:Transcript_31808/g.62543  ORF Transcript_31808/g.62543 Transcript_31808/m.62543 type:complete len:193 (+) Transcript_31808:54-632(+)
MALTAVAATAASAVTVASLAVVRSQHQHIEELEDTVGDLQQKAQQFESIPKLMSAKRREAHESTKQHLSRLDDRHSVKEQKIAALQEQLEGMLTTVNILRDKAAHFENVPKMFSVKQRESDIATQFQMSALEARASEKVKNLEKLHMNMRCLVEQVESFEQRVTVLEAARRRARVARLRNTGCWPRLSPKQP